MFCHNCGVELEEGEKFCYNCGAAVKVRKRVNVPPVPPVFEAVPAENIPEEPKVFEEIPQENIPEEPKVFEEIPQENILEEPKALEAVPQFTAPEIPQMSEEISAPEEEEPAPVYEEPSLVYQEPEAVETPVYQEPEAVETPSYPEPETVSMTQESARDLESLFQSAISDQPVIPETSVPEPQLAAWAQGPVETPPSAPEPTPFFQEATSEPKPFFQEATSEPKPFFQEAPESKPFLYDPDDDSDSSAQQPVAESMPQSFYQDPTPEPQLAAWAQSPVETPSAPEPQLAAWAQGPVETPSAPEPQLAAWAQGPVETPPPSPQPQMAAWAQGPVETPPPSPEPQLAAWAQSPIETPPAPEPQLAAWAQGPVETPASPEPQLAAWAQGPVETPPPAPQPQMAAWAQGPAEQPAREPELQETGAAEQQTASAGQSAAPAEQDIREVRKKIVSILAAGLPTISTNAGFKGTQMCAAGIRPGTKEYDKFAFWMKNFAPFSQEKNEEVSSILQKKGEAKLGIFYSNKGFHDQCAALFTDQRIIATTISGKSGRIIGYVNVPYSEIVRAYPSPQEDVILLDLRNGRRAGIRYSKHYVLADNFAKMISRIAKAVNGDQLSDSQAQPRSNSASHPASTGAYGSTQPAPTGGFGAAPQTPAGGNSSPQTVSYTTIPSDGAPQQPREGGFGSAPAQKSGIFGFGKRQPFNIFSMKTPPSDFGQTPGNGSYGQNTASYGYNAALVSSDYGDTPLSFGPEMPAEENQYSFRGNYKEYFYTVLSSAFPQLRIEQLSSNRGRDAALFVLKDNTGATKAVVEVISEKSSVKLMRKRCAEQQIPYSRFYYDHHGWWNTKSYVIYRVRKAMGM